MFSSNQVKFFHLLLFFSVCLASCGMWSKADENSNTDQPSFAAREIPSEIPFSTKEPEIYQAEIIVTNFINDEKFERKTFVARREAKRLTTFAAGAPAEISLLQIDAAQTFSLYPSRKIYRENSFSPAFPAATGGGGEPLISFLTAGWLHEKTSATFENLGADNNLTKFRVRLADSAAGEALIYIDENLKMPVRQEFYSLADSDRRTLLYSVEFRNFKSQADDALFELPRDYRQVPAEEFDKIVWQSRE